MVCLRETKVLGRAGARGGAGAERDGNDCNLVKLTRSLGAFMKITKFDDNFMFSLTSMKIS